MQTQSRAAHDQKEKISQRVEETIPDSGRDYFLFCNVAAALMLL